MRPGVGVGATLPPVKTQLTGGWRSRRATSAAGCKVSNGSGAPIGRKKLEAVYEAGEVVQLRRWDRAGPWPGGVGGPYGLSRLRTTVWRNPKLPRSKL
jgi:hypothetical protein